MSEIKARQRTGLSSADIKVLRTVDRRGGYVDLGRRNFPASGRVNQDSFRSLQDQGYLAPNPDPPYQVTERGYEAIEIWLSETDPFYDKKVG